MSRVWHAILLGSLLGFAAAAPAGAKTKLVAERNPKVVALNDRAIALYNRGQYDEAISILDEIIQRFPDSGLAYANRGGVYFKMGKNDEAIKDYTQAIALGRNDPVVVLNRGTAYFTKGDYDRALEDCNAIISTQPRYEVAYRTCGVAYEKKGERAKAFSSFDEAIRLNPRDAKTLKARGLAYAHVGDMARARADLDQAASIDPALSKDDEVISARADTKPAGAPASAQAAASQAAAATPAPPKVAAPGGETRVALVIGNGAYVSVPHLDTPRTDAAAIADALRRDGFTDVQLADDLSADAMRRALDDFSVEASTADWAVVYYAGHGIEVDGGNYLVPIDAKLKTDRSVHFEAIPLDTVLAAIDGAKKLRLVILDACRDDPFLVNMTRSVATRSVDRGLARVDPDNGGTLVAYSAKAGQVAIDHVAGEADSPFATALIAYMAKPGVEVRKFFGLVRDNVMAATDNRQEPFVYGSLGGEDYFFRKP